MYTLKESDARWVSGGLCSYGYSTWDEVEGADGEVTYRQMEADSAYAYQQQQTYGSYEYNQANSVYQAALSALDQAQAELQRVFDSNNACIWHPGWYNEHDGNF